MQLRSLQDENKQIIYGWQNIWIILVTTITYGMFSEYWWFMLFVTTIALYVDKILFRHLSSKEINTVSRLIFWTAILTVPFSFFVFSDFEFFTLPVNSTWTAWIFNHFLFIVIFIFIKFGSIYLTNITERQLN